MLREKAKAQVFLSSTTIGLRPVRAAAWEAIEAVGCSPVVMEEFGAVPDYPDSVCQDKIDASDVYIGLIGWRHGSRPKGSEQSYTEREYRYARLRGIPCLILLLSQELCEQELSAPAESAKVRDRQERFRAAVREQTTVTVSDLQQLRTEVTRSLRNCLKNELWGVPGIFGREKDLRILRHELVDERLNLCLYGIGGIGKSTLVQGFRTWADRQSGIDRDGARVWSQALPEPARHADAGVGGLALNDLADLTRSALGPAVRDVKTFPQLTDRMRRQLGDGRPTIVVLDNVWPTHVDPLRELYQGLSVIDEVSFLMTSRSREVSELFNAGAPREIWPREVHPLDEEASVDLLTWRVARTIGAASESARPDLYRLKQVFQPLARFADGHPEILRLLAGLIVRGGYSTEHLLSCAKDIEVELHEMQEKLENALDPGETLHASRALEATLDRLLGKWLAPGELSRPARDLLAICAALPPRPASYSSATLMLHWQAALATSALNSEAGREQAPLLYRPDGGYSPRRDRAFGRELASLCQTQLLRAEARPAGREARDQSAEDRHPEDHYALHAIVAGFFQDHLLDPGQRTELHQAAEQALRGELELGTPSNLSSMFAIESAGWQEKVSLWLYHLAHLQPGQARARMAGLYLDAFWWWGCYVEFPFCDLLIQNWARVVVPGEAADDHVEFLHHLRALQEQYPRGWEKAGSNMRPVEAALRGLAGLIGVSVDAPPGTYDDDEGRLHAQGMLRIFLAHCAFFRSLQRPLPAADFAAASTYYEAALASFVYRREHFDAYVDEWNEAWVLYELADLHASAGQAGEAEKFCDRAEALERDRVRRAQARGEEESVLEEVLAGITRVRADIAEYRGDLAAETRERARSVFYAFSHQVHPPQTIPCENAPGRYEGGPDDYTMVYYDEMTERAIRRVLELADQGRRPDSQSMARQLAASWQRQDRPEVVQVLDALADSSVTVPSPAELGRALFPPGFNRQADDLDEYVQRGLELVATAQETAARMYASTESRSGERQRS